jgi:hypothetical protein
MEIKTRRVKGDIFTNEDILDVRLIGDYTLLDYLVFSVELISGPSVTHGGGAPAGEYLHYKSLETDLDENDVLDYSNSQIPIVQSSIGTSVIKITGNYVLKDEAEKYKLETKNHKELLEKATDPEEYLKLMDAVRVLTIHEISTGEVTLSWNELDEYV